MAQCLWSIQGVLGGLLTLKGFLQYFPQVDTKDPPKGYTKSQASNIQGKYAVASLLVGPARARLQESERFRSSRI